MTKRKIVILTIKTLLIVYILFNNIIIPTYIYFLRFRFRQAINFSVANNIPIYIKYKPYYDKDELLIEEKKKLRSLAENSLSVDVFLFLNPSNFKILEQFIYIYFIQQPLFEIYLPNKKVIYISKNYNISNFYVKTKNKDELLLLFTNMGERVRKKTLMRIYNLKEKQYDNFRKHQLLIFIKGDSR